MSQTHPLSPDKTYQIQHQKQKQQHLVSPKLEKLESSSHQQESPSKSRSLGPLSLSMLPTSLLSSSHLSFPNSNQVLSSASFINHHNLNNNNNNTSNGMPPKSAPINNSNNYHLNSNYAQQPLSAISHQELTTPPNTPRHSHDYSQRLEKNKPTLYKTELCRSFEETNACRYGDKCQFAHTTVEVRGIDRHPKYKSELCKTFWEKGSCPYGKRCCFVHTEKESGPNTEVRRSSDPEHHTGIGLRSNASFTENAFNNNGMRHQSNPPQHHLQNPNPNFSQTWSGISPTHSSFSPTTPAHDSLEAQFNNMNLGDQVTLRRPSFNDYTQQPTSRNFTEFHHESPRNQYIELNDTVSQNHDYHHLSHQRPASQNSGSQGFESRFFEQHQRSYTSFNLDTTYMESLGKNGNQSAIGDRRRARTLSTPVGLFENQRMGL